MSWRCDPAQLVEMCRRHILQVIPPALTPPMANAEVNEYGKGFFELRLIKVARRKQRRGKVKVSLEENGVVFVYIAAGQPELALFGEVGRLDTKAAFILLVTVVRAENEHVVVSGHKEVADVYKCAPAVLLFTDLDNL